MEKWLNNNTVVRIIAVLVAILLWAVVHLDEQGSITPASPDIHTRTINEVQVMPVGLNTELFSINNIEPAHVTIMLRGKEETVFQVRPNASTGQNQIQLDLSSITQAGEHTINVESVGFPEEVDVTIYPTTAVVTVEEIQSKEVPVQIEVQGEPEEGYIADVPIINPIRAVVDVPSSILQQIVAVKAYVDISGATEAVEETGRLVAINDAGEEIDAIVSPSVVDIIVPITSPFTTVPLQVTLINEPAEGYSVSAMKLSENEVTIYGPESILSQINIYDEITVDLTNIRASQRISVPIPLMAGIHEVKPAAIDVELTIVPSIELLLEQIPITISGANHSYVTTITEPELGAIDVMIAGAASVLAGVQPEDVQAIVDVSNLPQGIHNLVVKLNLPRHIKFVGEEELYVTVEIAPREDSNNEEES